MSSVSQFFGGGRIKSIQRGVISIEDTAYLGGVRDVTINAVDTTKSILYHLGSPAYTTDSGIPYLFNVNTTVMLTLENSTTIRANIGSLIVNGQVSWQLVEYF
jgi:hypothetical protein